MCVPLKHGNHGSRPLADEAVIVAAAQAAAEAEAAELEAAIAAAQEEYSFQQETAIRSDQSNFPPPLHFEEASLIHASSAELAGPSSEREPVQADDGGVVQLGGSENSEASEHEAEPIEARRAKHDHPNRGGDAQPGEGEQEHGVLVKEELTDRSNHMLGTMDYAISQRSLDVRERCVLSLCGCLAILLSLTIMTPPSPTARRLYLVRPLLTARRAKVRT